MSVLEAMACGVPAIAPAVGGLKEIIEPGLSGYLIRERDPKIFAEKCLNLFENHDLRRNMASGAYSRVFSAFSVERMSEEYLELYNEICKVESNNYTPVS